MIKSMTGFAKAEQIEGGLHCQIEMRSVNHRHLEARVFLPKALSHLEENYKKLLRQWMSRGKVDCQITLDFDGVKEERLTFDETALSNFMSLKSQLEGKVGQDLELKMSDLLQVKGLLTYDQDELNEKAADQLIVKTLTQAAEGMVQMRSKEGELLAMEMNQRLELMTKMVAQVPQYREEVIANYKKKLEAAVEKAGGIIQGDDNRILTEIGVFIDKSDVTEELERFRTHLTHFDELMNSGVPVGRKLDFMLQEFNREANTLCSKAGHSKIAAIGVDLKVEIEKLREQVQNIE